MANPALGVKRSPARGTPAAETYERQAREPEPRVPPRAQLSMLSRRAARAGASVVPRVRSFSRSRPLAFLAAVGAISFAAGAALRIWRSRRYG